MPPAKFGLDPKRFAIVLERYLRLPLSHQQVAQKHMSVRELGIGPQGRFQLALRFVELARAPKDQGIVVSGGPIVWPQPKHNFEVIAPLPEIPGCGNTLPPFPVPLALFRPTPAAH